MERLKNYEIKRENEFLLKNLNNIYQKPQFLFLPFFNRQKLLKNGTFNEESVK
jgi:hypothetical protein